MLNFFSLGSQKSITSFGTTIGHLWEICGLSVAVLGRAQVDCRLHDHFASTVAYLLPKCALSMAFPFSLFHLSTFDTSLYIIGVQNTQRFGVFVQKIGEFGE